MNSDAMAVHQQSGIWGAEIPLCSECTTGTESGFVNAVTVWINKPHVVNRRLCGSRINYFNIIQKSDLNETDTDILLARLGFVVSHGQGPLTHEAVGDGHYKLDNGQHDIDDISDLLNLSSHEVALIVREMLPKQPERHRNIPELIVYIKSDATFSFHPLKSVDEDDNENLEVAYKFSFLSATEPSVQLSTNSSEVSCDSKRKLSLTWIQNQLLKKLARWSEEPNLKTSLTSLKLVSLEDYSRLYSELKNKYGLHFAKIWPEKTDPQKFVFEDVAIATYLLLLWKQERVNKNITTKQSFVDLGCGNGLLVHILASEGHPGYGLDVRKRSIWDLYGPVTVLKEETVTPSTESLFPEIDWLIGNHSDELTPWIPVMAARSSYNCCYMVLPCCHYDFNCKFKHDTKTGGGPAGDGQYRSYLNFVKTVGETCGFAVEEDMLRIPSTKRVCFVGRNRTYTETEETEVDKLRQDYISARCVGQENLENKDQSQNHTSSDDVDSSKWVSDFTPRDKVELTRNCVTVCAETKEHVVQTVFKHIMGMTPCGCSVEHDGKTWRKGGSFPICDVVKLFDKDLLQELKSECGGLQTLLRNSSHIFQVSSGRVQLRDFTLDDPFEGRKAKGKPSDRSEYFKTAMCWFFENHPDGCPRISKKCLYAHGQQELRERPKKLK